MAHSNDPTVGLYRKKSRFLSVNGLVLYRALSSIVGNRSIIFANVPASTVLQPEKGLSAMEQRMQTKKIEPLLFDFVLCSPSNFSLHAVIHTVEPGKPSMNERASRDLMDAICQSADLPLVRMEFQAEYDLEELKKYYRTAHSRRKASGYKKQPHCRPKRQCRRRSKLY